MSRLKSVALIAVLLVSPSLMAADTIPNDRAAAEHAVRRLTYGPRPGDVDRVQRIGVAAWIDQQLNPSNISDSALDGRLPAPPARPVTFGDPKAARKAARDDVQALAAERLTRAVYSDRQLEEILVDFWFNHFNVFAGKGRTALFVRDYERDAIRPHVLGRFRDLLEATAHHPAMLFYLDNWLSVDPNNTRAQGQGPKAQNKRRGLNENYARELLELHTLGVDGGYTQKDVTEVARAFTGWTITGQRDGGDFRFVRRMHDTGRKVVLGHTIAAGGGVEDGERVLDMVASHPSTARHIARELAQRFVSDEPPESLVTKAAARFTATDGDLREVVRTILTSPEFFATDVRSAKIKTPLEFVVSAVRASGNERVNAMDMDRALRQLGMPLYMCQPPTGYDDTADAWVGAGAIVSRINLASRLAGSDASLVSSPEFQRR
jgi:uncharacterized protein (DUF1800 family)